MGYYKDYLDGNMSETDFLYNAYGKDLLKESGYDLESTLFWYSRHKQGDYSNPLDNDTFLAKLIADSRALFEKESFYETIAKKDRDLMLQGMVSNMSLGTKLSNEQVEQLFEPQIAQLKDYFNDDVSKILTYYKSGNLSNVFNPFIDIDDDGKFDYYYHVDGKMYACEEGSTAKGVKKNLTADVSYNEDGSVHEVEINDGLTGFGGAFFEGLGSFATSLVDTLYTL
jgi:hypothetical protein